MISPATASFLKNMCFLDLFMVCGIFWFLGQKMTIWDQPWIRDNVKSSFPNLKKRKNISGADILLQSLYCQENRLKKTAECGNQEFLWTNWIFNEKSGFSWKIRIFMKTSNFSWKIRIFMETPDVHGKSEFSIIIILLLLYYY